MLKYFKVIKDDKKQQNPVAPASNGLRQNDSKDSKDKKPASQPQSKQTKDVKKEENKKVEQPKKQDEKLTQSKTRSNKMEEEKPSSIGTRRSQTPKSPPKNKIKELSPSPPRSSKSSNQKKGSKQDEIITSSKQKVPATVQKTQTPKKDLKKSPQQNKNNNKKNKAEVENSGTEDLEGTATESLTEPALSEKEEEIQQKKKFSGGYNKKIVDSSEDEQLVQPKIQQIKSQKPPPLKQSNKKAILDEDEYDEEEELDEKPQQRGRDIGKRLIKGGARKAFDEDEDEEEEKDEVIEIKKTTNRTKVIEEKQQQVKDPKSTANKGSTASKPSQNKGAASKVTNNQSSGSQLSGEIIVFTGEFDGISRETLAKVVIDHGAKNTGSISGKTTILVHGSILEDGRPPEEGKKYKTAQEKGTKIMNQSKFSDYLKVKVGKSLEELANIGQGGGVFDKFAANKNVSTPATTPAVSSSKTTSEKQQDDGGSKKKILQPINKPKELTKYDPKKVQATTIPGSVKSSSQTPANNQQQQAPLKTAQMANLNQGADQLWTHKHAPQSIKDCVGNQKNLEKMMEWLQDWVEVVIKGKKKKVANSFYNRAQPFGDNSSNVNAKACLLSGPPGVGKTTSVRLIAKFMGYEIREWNASDQRSKKSVNNIIGELKNNSILQLLKKGDPNAKGEKADDEVETKSNKKFIILMDEVDGMSSGDRGGNQALIDAIKSTNVPIFCICNDRMNQKVRSLANYCYDIKFNKPPKQDIAKYMKNVCEREGIFDVEAEAIELISERFGNDLRQTLNYLEMHFKNSKQLKKDNLTKLKLGQKDTTVMLEAFEASTQLMQSFKFQKLTLRERIELFFIDYDLIPLLVHQNYLDTIQPRFDKQKKPCSEFSVAELQNLADATASIAQSDLLSTQIRTNGNWALLPNFAFLSSIYPCDKICEDKPIYPRFPEWLGKYQTTKKTTRELREFRISISTAISGSRFAVKFDYVPVLQKLILSMLKKGGDANIETVLDILEYYNIKPEHLKEHLNDLQYPKLDYYSEIPSDTKSKLTRQYNKRYSDDSRKIKGPKKAKKEDSQGKYDKNLDDIVYSETEEQISGAESGGEDNTDKKQQKKGQKQQKKSTKLPQAKNKKGKSKDSGTEDLSQDEEGTNSLDSFIEDDEE